MRAACQAVKRALPVMVGSRSDAISVISVSGASRGLTDPPRLGVWGAGSPSGRTDGLQDPGRDLARPLRVGVDAVLLA